MKSPRFIVAIFAALAMTVLVNARFAFSQDAADSDSSAAVSGTSYGYGIYQEIIAATAPGSFEALTAAVIREIRKMRE